MKKLILFSLCVLAYSSAFAKESEKKEFTLANTKCALKIKSESTPVMTDIQFVEVDSHMLGKMHMAQHVDKDISYSAMIMGSVLKKDPSIMILSAEIGGTNIKSGDQTHLKGALVMTKESRHGMVHFNSISADGKELVLAVTCEVAE